MLKKAKARLITTAFAMLALGGVAVSYTHLRAHET